MTAAALRDCSCCSSLCAVCEPNLANFSNRQVRPLGKGTAAWRDAVARELDLMLLAPHRPLRRELGEGPEADPSGASSARPGTQRETSAARSGASASRADTAARGGATTCSRARAVEVETSPGVVLRLEDRGATATSLQHAGGTPADLGQLVAVATEVAPRTGVAPAADCEIAREIFANRVDHGAPLVHSRAGDGIAHRDVTPATGQRASGSSAGASLGSGRCEVAPRPEDAREALFRGPLACATMMVAVDGGRRDA